MTASKPLRSFVSPFTDLSDTDFSPGRKKERKEVLFFFQAFSLLMTPLSQVGWRQEIQLEREGRSVKQKPEKVEGSKP